MVTTTPTTVTERNELRTALAHATARPWGTVWMHEGSTAVMAGHQHEGFVADCLYPPNAAAIALAVNLAGRLADDVERLQQAVTALRAALDRNRAAVWDAHFGKGLALPYAQNVDRVALAAIMVADGLIAPSETP